MPPIRRRRLRARRSYDHQHVRDLLGGVVLRIPGVGFTGPDCRIDEEARREAWEDLGEAILAAWIPRFPGTRPLAWWDYEAPEPRRRVDGRPHPFDRRRRASRETHRGRPRYLETRDDFEAEYESEREYLQRLGLLEGEELRRGEDLDDPRPKPEDYLAIAREILG